MSSPSSSSSAHTHPASERVLLKVIAIFKAIKSLGMILVAIAALRLYQPGNFYTFVDWLAGLPLMDYNLGQHLVDKVIDLGPHQFVWLGLLALGYALIFGIEGCGLWLGKHWAEWFTVIATGSLIPFELYELIHKANALKLLALVINITIVIYLVRVARRPRQ